MRSLYFQLHVMDSVEDTCIVIEDDVDFQLHVMDSPGSSHALDLLKSTNFQLHVMDS